MNPNLIGYSEGDGNTYSENAQFNVAFNGAMDQDLMEQATRLIRRMKKDKRVDFQNQWKVILPFFYILIFCILYEFLYKNFDTEKTIGLNSKNFMQLYFF